MQRIEVITGNPYRFGEVEVDPARLSVTLRGEPVDLEPKAIRVLLYLLENRQRVVTKEELFREVWSGVEVTDNALTRVVGQLRKGLGDRARNARFIETVPTIGYRFIARVEGEAPVEGASALAGPAAGAGAWPSWTGPLIAVLIAVGAAMMFFATRPPAARPRLARLRQITNSRGLDMSPALSPDGRLLVYSSDRTGQFELWVRPVGANGDERQLTRDGGGNVEADWSPDGAAIAFHCMSRGGICVIPAAGGAARLLTRFGSQPSWSPDGKRIAFRSMRMISPASGDMQTAFPGEIWLADAVTGAARRLSPADPPGSYTTPAFSPDGRWVLATVFEAGRSATKIVALNASTGVVHALLEAPAGLYSPRLAADGRTLFYARHVKADGKSVFRMPVHPETMTAAGEPVEIHASPDQPQNLRVSPDGRSLVASSVSATSNLMRIDPSRPASPASAVTSNTNERNTSPAFSPDGQWIAYHTRRLGQPVEVWRARPDGTDAELVHGGPGGSFGPQWLPEPGRLMFLSGGTRQPVLFSFNGRVATPVSRTLPREAELTPASYPHVGADGREVFLHGRRGANLRPAAFDWRTGAFRWLTNGEVSAGFPTPSPDLRWVAVELLRDHSAHLAVVPAAGGEPRVLTDGLEQAWPYSWSPDSRRIAFAAQREGVWNIWSLDVATGEQRRLTDHRSARTFARYPAWSPRGDAIVFEASEVTGNIVMLDLEPSHR